MAMRIFDVDALAKGMQPDKSMQFGKFAWKSVLDFAGYQDALHAFPDATGFIAQPLDSALREIIWIMLNGQLYIIFITLKEAYLYNGSQVLGVSDENARITPRYTTGQTTAIANDGPDGVGRVMTTTADLQNAHFAPKPGDRYYAPDEEWYTIATINGENEFDLTEPYGTYSGDPVDLEIRCLFSHGLTNAVDWVVFAGNLIMTNYSDPPFKWTGSGNLQPLGGVLEMEGPGAITKFRAKCVTAVKGFVIFGNLVIGTTLPDVLPTRFAWSCVGDHEQWVVDGPKVGADWEIFDDAESGITAMEVIPPYGFAAFTQDKIYVASLSDPQYTGRVISWEQRAANIGTLSPKSVCRFRQYIAFMGADLRPYIFDGAQLSTDFAYPVNAVFEKNISNKKKHLVRALHLPHRNQLAFVFPIQPGLAQTAIKWALLYNYEDGSWVQVTCPELTAFSSGPMERSPSLAEIPGTLADYPDRTLGDFALESLSHPLWGNVDGNIFYWDLPIGFNAVFTDRTPEAVSNGFTVGQAGEVATITKIEFLGENLENIRFFIGVADSQRDTPIWIGRQGENSTAGFKNGDDCVATGSWFYVKLTAEYSTGDFVAPNVHAMRVHYAIRGVMR